MHWLASLENTAAASPYTVELVNSTASASVSNVVMLRTGPKILQKVSCQAWATYRGTVPLLEPASRAVSSYGENAKAKPTIFISCPTLTNAAQREPFSFSILQLSTNPLTNRGDKITFGGLLLVSTVQNLRAGCLTRLDVTPNLIKLRLGDQRTGAGGFVVSRADLVLQYLSLEDRQEFLVHR